MLALRGRSVRSLGTVSVATIFVCEFERGNRAVVCYGRGGRRKVPALTVTGGATMGIVRLRLDMARSKLGSRLRYNRRLQGAGLFFSGCEQHPVASPQRHSADVAGGQEDNQQGFRTQGSQQARRIGVVAGRKPQGGA